MFEFLVTCALQRPDTALLGEILATGALAPMVAFARWHHVEDGLLLALEQLEAGQQPFVEELAEGHRRRVVQQLIADLDLVTVRSVLDAAEVSWLVVKGPVLAELAYSNPALRPYGDLDIVVAQSHFDTAVTLLEQAGARVIDRNWDLIIREKRGQLHMALTAGTVGDLHWHLVNHAWQRHAMDVPMAALFERARRVELSSGTVHTLDPVDTLLHVSLHAALSGGHRLRWLADVARLVTVERPDWDDVVSRARDWGIGPSVGLVLQRARRLAGADVPPDVHDALLSTRLQHAAGWIDERSTPHLRPGEVSAGTIWAQSIRARLRPTVGAVLRRVARPGLAPLKAHGRGEGDSYPILSATGTDLSRELYLTWVRATAPSGTDVTHVPSQRPDVS